jgi:hypothetical protein
MWVVFRCRLALAYCLHGVIVLLAFVGVLLHNGLAYQDAGYSGIAAAGMLLLVQSLTLLVFGALVAERRFAEDWLRRANQTLEAKVTGISQPERNRLHQGLEAEPQSEQEGNDAEDKEANRLLQANRRREQSAEAVALNHPCRPAGRPPVRH